MDIAEFEDWLDRLGDDVSQWPAPQRDAARALLAQSDAARDLLAEAAVLRRALAAPPVRAPAGLADRIVLQARHEVAAPAAIPALPPRSRAFRLPPLAFRIPAAVALPLCFAAGLLVGIFHGLEELDVNRVDLPAYVAHVVDMAHGID